MYNDVDMVWLQDPFQYLEGKHDAYFMDDMTPVCNFCTLLIDMSATIFGFRLFMTFYSFWCQIKPLDHSHDLPPPGKKGRTYMCSCMIFLRPTNGAKLLMKKRIEELQDQPWSKAKKANDQPAFNWALNKTAHQVCFCFL